MILLNGPTDDGTFADEMILADEFGQISRTHPFGERPRRVEIFTGLIFEKVGHDEFLLYRRLPTIYSMTSGKAK
jgi:hypothetical protein